MSCCKNNDTIKKELDQIFDKYPQTEDYLIMILNDVQQKFGYIPLHAQYLIAQHLDLSMAHIYGVITFYSRFSLKPKGKYVISVCLGTACFVKGSSNLLNYVSEKLHINAGETTPDGLFSIDEVRCVGACGLAPVFIVNNHTYGNASITLIDQVINDILDKEGLHYE